MIISHLMSLCLHVLVSCPLCLERIRMLNILQTTCVMDPLNSHHEISTCKRREEKLVKDHVLKSTALSGIPPAATVPALYQKLHRSWKHVPMSPRSTAYVLWPDHGQPRSSNGIWVQAVALGRRKDPLALQVRQESLESSHQTKAQQDPELGQLSHLHQPRPFFHNKRLLLNSSNSLAPGRYGCNFKSDIQIRLTEW